MKISMNVNMKIFFLSALSVLVIVLFYQAVFATGEVPAPAPAQSQAIVLTNGTIHTAAGATINNGAIRFENGVITEIGQNVSSANAEVIDLEGKHVYPGLIAPNTTLGLTEIDAVRATRDFNEVGTWNPNVRSIIAYNTDSRIIPTIRNNGILLAHIVPQGGRIPGISSVVQLDAWNWEDAAYETDNALHLNWPSMYVRRGWWAEPGGIDQNQEYENQVKEIYSYFEEVKAYFHLANPQRINLRFETMKSLFDGTAKIFIDASSAREIKAAIRFIEDFNLNGVLTGVEDAYLVADFLAEKEIPVILRRLHSLPSRQDDHIESVYRTPAILQEAGVLFALSLGGSWQQRNLPFIGGSAAAYGLSKEDALKSLTINAAKILGIDNRTGSLETGKDANIVVSTGDILDMTGNHITHAYIQGRKINLDDKQKQLYRKYMQKYE